MSLLPDQHSTTDPPTSTFVLEEQLQEFRGKR
ncbi:hypothetical protein J2X05_000976 [Cellvibrio fibrivorans]|uniref:Uncharacterized protein n=1 Tax=Cellvibrio fibrivorans TaxID=126350 RepID=A0ABU1UUX6_9GAMM|nr:hypothetical protein [Cellvibrio fibrivorans]